MKSFVLPSEHAPARLDKTLALLLDGVTRETVKRWIQEGRVTVDGSAAQPKTVVRAGARIEVSPGPEPKSDVVPDASVPFRVLYEDDDLVVVDKPAGVVVHPAKGHWEGTLVHGLLARPGFERAPSDPHDEEGHLRPGIVHRIDKETSGILVVAKTPQAREGLKEQLARHTVEREYLAITIGVPREGRIETLHGRDPRSRLKFSSKVKEGKTAITTVKIIERAPGNRAALVRCQLETGRTHQIRVHLSQERGTPILADALYGGFRGPPEVIEQARALGRHALHAAVLGFLHPVSEQRLRFELEVPSDMALAWGKLSESPAQ